MRQVFLNVAWLEAAQVHDVPGLGFSRIDDANATTGGDIPNANGFVY